VAFVVEKGELGPKCDQCLVIWIFGSKKEFYRDLRERRRLEHAEAVENGERSKPGIRVWMRPTSHLHD